MHSVLQIDTIMLKISGSADCPVITPDHLFNRTIIINNAPPDMKPLLKKYKAGTILFHENDSSRELYIIQTGKVKIYRMIGKHEMQLAVLGEGSVLGEMALIVGEPRSVSAKVIEDSDLIQLDSKTFDEEIEGVPPWFMTIIKMTIQKIYQAKNRLQNISSEHQGPNIIITILYFFNFYDKHNNGLDIAQTRLKLVQLLGVTLHKVTSIISFLHERGFLEIKDERMFLCSRKEMEDYCSFLRLLIRKQFEKLQPLDNEAFGIVEKIWNSNGEIRKFEEGLTEISGDAFLSFVENTSYSSKPDELLEMLRSQSMLTYTIPCNSGDSISNYILKIDNMKWKRIYLYSKFNQLIPTT
ncbi:MAG TPA: cyclic nucleotide-binding domain-containing protein [Chitinispirillaceae bacterium]|nr:cyclic nucleotide-binding domain-containing protein [Chitinispirillaceae bacterium]